MTQPGQRGKRIILYCDDTFGLGHLRRSLALAAAMTENDPTASVLNLTDSPFAGRFSFPERVDHVRLPGIILSSDGSRMSATLCLDIDDITTLRAGLIQSAVAAYGPDLLIVDTEPVGFRDELRPTLESLIVRRGTRVVLGLHDGLDGPDMLMDEGARNTAIEATERYYDEIWVYGSNFFADPTDGLPLSESMRACVHWIANPRRGGLLDGSEFEGRRLAVDIWSLRRCIRKAHWTHVAARSDIA